MIDSGMEMKCEGAYPNPCTVKDDKQPDQYVDKDDKCGCFLDIRNEYELISQGPQ